MPKFLFTLPADFADYEWEVTAKGCFSEARLTVSDKHYRLNFYDATRLGQEIESELARGEHGVARVRGDEAVGDGAHALAAPPRRLGVGRHADGAGDVRRPPVAGLDLPVVEAGGEVEDRLAAGGGDDVADVAADEGAAGEHAEVERLERREQAVVAADGEDRLPRLDLVAVDRPA